MEHLQSWIEGQAVAHLAWAFTVLGAVAILVLALPGAFRRLMNAGDRAPTRIAISAVLAILGCAVLIGLDHGYRTSIGTTYASENAVESSQILLARKPFPIDRFYAFDRIAGTKDNIAGALPELRIPSIWTDGGRDVNAAIVGLPLDLSTSFRATASPSSSLHRMLSRWERVVNRIPTGHAFIDQGLATAMHLQRNDVLFRRYRGKAMYLTIDGVLADGQLSGRKPSIIVSLPQAQSLSGLTGRISDVQIVYSSRETDLSETRNEILSAARGIPSARLASTMWSFPSSVRVAVQGAFDHWLAVAGGLVMLLACVSLWILGRIDGSPVTPVYARKAASRERRRAG